MKIDFDGLDNLERNLSCSNTPGYGMTDTILWGLGLEGLELIDINAKINEILGQCESTKVELDCEEGHNFLGPNVNASVEDIEANKFVSCVVNYIKPVVPTPYLFCLEVLLISFFLLSFMFYFMHCCEYVFGPMM